MRNLWAFFGDLCKVSRGLSAFFMVFRVPQVWGTSSGFARCSGVVLGLTEGALKSDKQAHLGGFRV